MKPERQNQVIAELCGWKDIRRPSDDSYHNLATDILGGLMGRVAGIRPGESDHEPLPNYHGDLNACAKMENHVLSDADTGYEYDCTLNEVCGCWEDGIMNYMKLWHASASQRCEAFLRVHGKWEEA